MKNRIVEAVTTEVNEFADTVRIGFQVPRDPLDLERNTMMGANLKKQLGLNPGDRVSCCRREEWIRRYGCQNTKKPWTDYVKGSRRLVRQDKPL